MLLPRTPEDLCGGLGVGLESKLLRRDQGSQWLRGLFSDPQGWNKPGVDQRMTEETTTQAR